jgi:hypothetical protein
MLKKLYLKCEAVNSLQDRNRNEVNKEEFQTNIKLKHNGNSECGTKQLKMMKERKNNYPNNVFNHGERGIKVQD